MENSFEWILSVGVFLYRQNKRLLLLMLLLIAFTPAKSQSLTPIESGLREALIDSLIVLESVRQEKARLERSNDLYRSAYESEKMAHDMTKVTQVKQHERCEEEKNDLRKELKANRSLMTGERIGFIAVIVLLLVVDR